MKINTPLLIVGLLLAATVLIAACTSSTEDNQNNDPPVTDNDEDVNLFDDDLEIKTLKDGTKYIVNPDKIRGGGPPKDGIPSIDNPKFVSVEEADEWIEDDELILVMEHKGVKRVYPFQILVFHEIVNDFIADDPILITYCPLCGSGIAYERTLSGETVEFGTSGKLYNSNLVMYDRKTDTYWSQIGGRAIVGELTGQKLTLLDSNTVEWGPYRDANPDAEVLSRNTGYARLYGRDPYGSYYIDSDVWFPLENTDNTIHSKSVIFGIEINEVFKAYREIDLKKEKVVEDTVGGVNIKLEIDDVGLLTITNIDTGEEIPKERDFWFAWAAFHSETELYGQE